MIDRYRQKLQSIPAPGYGCHVSLLGVANVGLRAGIDPSQIFNDISQAIPRGTRQISDREKWDAIKKAVNDYQPSFTLPSGETYYRYNIPKPQRIVKDGKAALQRIIKQSKISTEADLFDNSPIRLWNTPKYDPELFFSILFEPDNLLFIGDQYEAGIIGQNIRRVSDWLTAFRKGEKLGCHFIINPLSGNVAKTKTGEDTLRGDSNVFKFRYCLGEFDNLSREDQISFWMSVKLPISALIDSGNKSIHALIDIQELATVKSADDWDKQIRGRLFEQGLIPMGVDRACKNPSRMARTPGVLRDTGRFQKLLWLKGKENGAD